MNTSPGSIRWLAMKLFIGPPLLFAMPVVAMVLLNQGVARSVPLLAQVAAFLGTVAVMSYLLAPVFARLCLGSVAAGCFFGVLLCATGAVAFGLTAAVVYPDFSPRAYFWVTIGWFAVCGFPLAALIGLFFAGGAQRLATPDSESSVKLP